jgi:hypothetical protein
MRSVGTSHRRYHLGMMAGPRSRPSALTEAGYVGEDVENILLKRVDSDQALRPTAGDRSGISTFTQHRATVEAFVDCMHGGADKDALARILAENVVLIGPLSDELLTGREAVTAAIQGVSTVAADLTYKEVLSGATHHAALFRLQIEDTAVNGMDYILLAADGKIAEVTIFWRPLPSAVEMQGHLAPLVGMQPWELRTKGE